MTWWQLGRNRREPVADAAPAVPLIMGPVEPVDAWRDLPTLQRTLADTLRPVAITDSFRDSLASYADPSFVAPLAHQVDPGAGGLVEGLVSPGVPYAHAGGAELVVPSPPKPALPKRAATSTGSGLIAQRTVITPGSARLPTVPLELPEIEMPIPQSAAAALGATVSGDAPSVVDHGSEVAAPATHGREFPVVVRSADRPTDRELPLNRDSVGPPRRPELGPAPTTRDLPVVSRSATSATESPPLSGLAEAIAR
jgi:hypothetical protein